MDKWNLFEPTLQWLERPDRLCTYLMTLTFKILIPSFGIKFLTPHAALTLHGPT